MSVSGLVVSEFVMWFVDVWVYTRHPSLILYGEEFHFHFHYQISADFENETETETNRIAHYSYTYTD